MQAEVVYPDMTLLHDIRFALRTLVKSPGFTAVAVTALALGIGANATVFTLTNAILFKGFPFDHSDRILYLNTKDSSRAANQFSGISFPDFRDWREQTKSFEGLAAWTGERISISDKNGLPETFQASRISANAFRLIGQKPAIGRDFDPADDAPGAALVAILNDGLWQRRYGSNREIVGQTIRINGTQTTVLGVMPRGFAFPFDADVWMPFVPKADSEKREARGFVAFGRLKDGTTASAARAEMATIGRNLQSSYPATNQGIDIWVRTYSEFYLGPFITTIFLAMLGAVGFVLLIACANVANLLLGRAVVRSREISIRVALGAGRWRIVRQLLVESVMLSIAGGAIGWLIALWGVHAFDMATVPFNKPSWMKFVMDYRVFAYLVAISIGTGILFGLAPALRLAKLDVNTSLKDGGRGASAGGRGKHLSSVLVIAEVALAVMLLAGAGLMVRTFLNIYRASLGINENNVLTMRLPLPDAKYPKPADQIAFHERLHAQLAAVPGVQAVAIANFLPTGGSMHFPYELEGAPPPGAQRRPSLAALVITTDYFRVMDVRPLAGRAFADDDGVAGPPVAIVNERFASKAWPGESPLGKRLRLFSGATAEPWLIVVGEVPNIVQNDTTPKEIDPLIYIPYRQKPQVDMAIVARTQVPPGTLAMPFRKAIQAVDSDLPVYNVWTMQQRLERNYWFFRVTGILFVIFAAIALFLASIGLYAVMAHSVSQRTQEIGLRMAMGATARAILRLLFKQGMVRAMIGLAVGLFGAFAITRVMKAALVQVAPADPVTFAIAALILALTTALGCWIPARRAMRVDPMVALRHE
jgi:putative ABC transport system permease protein